MPKILLENRPSLKRQTAWTTIGLPEPLRNDSGSDRWVKVVADSGRVFPAVASGMELRVRATLEARERLVCSVLDDDRAPESFAYHKVVVDDPTALIPEFAVEGAYSEAVHYWSPGTGPKPAYILEVEHADPAMVRWHFRTRILAADLTIEGWLDLYSRQDWAELIVRVTYGTTASTALFRTLPSV